MESNNYALVRILFEAIINYFLLVRNKYAKQMEDHITLLHIIQLRHTTQHEPVFSTKPPSANTRIRLFIIVMNLNS